MPETRTTCGGSLRDVTGPERAGLGVLTLVSACVLLATPHETHAGRQFTSVRSASVQWVAVPNAVVGVPVTPAVASPAESVELSPAFRDPMVLATAVLEHHRLVTLSLRGGLYGP